MIIVSDYDVYQNSMELLEAGNAVQAAINLYPLSKDNPDNRMVSEALGRSLFHSGLYGLAAQTLQRVVRHHPIEDYSHFLLGKTYELIGWSHLAGGHYKMAMALNPNNPHYQLSFELYQWNHQSSSRG